MAAVNPGAAPQVDFQAGDRVVFAEDATGLLVTGEKVQVARCTTGTVVCTIFSTKVSFVCADAR